MKSPVQCLLERAQPGSSGGVGQHIARGELILQAVAGRFQVSRVEHIRAKHLRWYLEHGLPEDLSPATRYKHWLTARVLAAALGKWPEWEPYLRGPWRRPDGKVVGNEQGVGGRPPKLAACARRRRGIT